MEYPFNKKICVFTIHPAKDVRVFSRHCRTLVRLGFDVTLIALSNDGNYIEEDVKVIGIPKWTSMSGRFKTLFAITKLAFKQKAHIYHFHDPDLLLFAPWLRLFSGKPVVYDIHEFYTRQIPLKVPNIKPLRMMVSGIVLVTESILGRMCGAVSAVYQAHVDRFAKLGCKTAWTPNFVSLKDYKMEPVTDEIINERKNTVIHSGSMSPVRGSLLLVDIAKELKQRRPEMRVIATGQFQAEYHRDLLMEKLEKPEFKDVLELVPRLTINELPSFVKSGGIGLSLLQHHGQYVVPTNVPTKFFEYMSQGVPIVASDVPSSYTYVENEGAGLVVKADDVNAYVEAILKIVDDIDLYHIMADNGQKAVVEKYSWEIAEKNLGEFYSKLLK